MHDLTPFQLISLIALGASLLNFLRVVWFKPNTTPTTRTSPVPSIRKPPSPLAKPGTPAAPLPKPGAAPVGKQEVLPSSLDSGVTGHQKAAAAKTVKLPIAPSKGTDGKPSTEALPSPPAPPVATSKPRISTGGTSVVEGKPSDADAAALDSLFGNSGKADGADTATGLPGETKTGAIKRKASRLGELGFHHSIQPEDTESGSKPAIAAAPRSSTAELTSILERIDKFLAEDTPPKATEALKPVEATKAGPAASAIVATAPVDQAQVKTEPIPASPSVPAPATEAMTNNATEKPEATKKTQPLWARADAQDEDVKPAAGGDEKSGDEKKPDEGQQRLF